MQIPGKKIFNNETFLTKRILSAVSVGGARMPECGQAFRLPMAARIG